eukprot:3804485-Rhodomonas_salina.1
MVSFDPLTLHDSCPSPVGVCCSCSGITTTSSRGVAFSYHHFTISQCVHYGVHVCGTLVVLSPVNPGSHSVGL